MGAGVAKERNEDVDGAILCYERAVLLDPSDVLGFVNLGDALVRRSRHVEATRAYARALDLDLEEPWGVLNNLGAAFPETHEALCQSLLLSRAK